MQNRDRKSVLRLIKRTYIPRIIGLAFASIAISFVLTKSDTSPIVWALLVFWGLAWPHLAYQLTKKSKKPLKTELNIIFIDAFMVGFWVPIMSFSLIPSLGILCMHLLSITSVLGIKKAAIGLATELLGILVAVMIFGFSPNFEIDIYSLIASSPMLFIYPLLVGYTTYMVSTRLAAKQNTLKQLSRTDSLTGLNNRMHWEEQLANSFKMIKRNNSKACIVFIDVDHFKSFNDCFGHIVGDEVLQKISHLLLDCIRETDICGRYGGEEFCILMPDTDKNSAEKLSERIRLHIANSKFHDQHQITGTISLGIAEISPEMESYSDWLNSADKALYQAKNQGRNQTVIAE